MKVLLFHLDGKLPNLALMRIAAHHRALGDDIELRRTGQPEQMPLTGINDPDVVYASAIFRKSIPTVERLKAAFPNAIVGGTAVDPPNTGELVPLSHVLSPVATNHGLGEGPLDYSAYPDFRPSIGFTQRGCRLKCEFCVVPKKEGSVRPAQSIRDIWRGDPHPREIILLDNDFFGNPEWRERTDELREGRFKVCFSQGINARCLTDEAAEAIASLDYRSDGMKTKRIYTAFDNKHDWKQLFIGLNRLRKYGVKPDHVMVYMLIGFWPGEDHSQREIRRILLREWGARPYPMPYVRTPELVGYQRWVIGAYDKNPHLTWAAWEANGYRPEGIKQ